MGIRGTAGGGAGGGGGAVSPETAESFNAFEGALASPIKNTQLRNSLRQGWEEMSPEDRQFVTEALAGGTVSLLNVKGDWLGESTQRGGSVRFNQRNNFTRLDPERVASILVHEAGHAHPRLGGGEAAATERSLRFAERNYQRALNRGDAVKAGRYAQIATAELGYRRLFVREAEDRYWPSGRTDFGGAPHAGYISASSAFSFRHLNAEQRLNLRYRENRGNFVRGHLDAGNLRMGPARTPGGKRPFIPVNEAGRAALATVREHDRTRLPYNLPWEK